MKNMTIVLTAIIALFTFTQSANAAYGGVVKSRGAKIFAECIQYDDKVCVEFEIHRQGKDADNSYVINTIKLVDTSDLSDEARKEANDRLKETYQMVGVIGMMPGFGLMWAGNGLGLPLMIAGGAVDIVKAPIVFVGYLGHKILDLGGKRRIKKLIKFMFNEKEAGETKRTRNRYFTSIEDAMWSI
ncbi:MAG: hypothetical protein GY909_08655 [Oligoflexia bacterium]|nr:hypothetical protein [Oligoflexia bacterium]